MWFIIKIKNYVKWGYRGSPSYMKITIMVSTTTAFGSCRCKWGIFMLVGDPPQSHKHEFHVTCFFPNSKMRLKWGPSIVKKKPFQVPPALLLHLLLRTLQLQLPSNGPAKTHLSTNIAYWINKSQMSWWLQKSLQSWWITKVCHR